MIDVDLENINFIPDGRLKMMEIENVDAIQFENRKLKFLVVVLTITFASYCIKKFVDKIKDNEDPEKTSL